MTVWLELDDAEQAERLLTQVEQLFIAAEARLSRFAPESELMQLNARAGDWVAVSPILWQLVARAVALAEETDGLFDPTMLDALVAAGYDRSFDDIRKGQFIVETASTTPIECNRPVSSFPTFRDIQLDADRHRIWLPAGLRLDLGGIGKGYTAQTAVSFLNHWGASLVDAGGDVTAGLAPAGTPGWSVGIAAPYISDAPRPSLLRFWLVNASVATSGVDYRRWHKNGASQHHLIDPRNRQPADGNLLTTSVLTRDACRAEAWATAALIAGQEIGYQQLVDQEIAAALITNEREILLTPELEPRAVWAHEPAYESDATSVM